MPTMVSTYSKHAGCVLRLLNRTDCYVRLHQKRLWLFMFEMHLISGITDGWQGCESTPVKQNVMTGPYLACFLVFSILLISVDNCFCVFRSVFRYIQVLYSRSIPDLLFFSTMFWVLATGIPSAKFPLAQTSSCAIAPDQSKVVLQMRDMCGTSSSILQ